jgi:hypothetical protein
VAIVNLIEEKRTRPGGRVLQEEERRRDGGVLQEEDETRRKSASKDPSRRETLLPNSNPDKELLVTLTYLPT